VVDLLNAQLAFVSHRGSDASRPLLKAATRLEQVDVDLARATYLDALNAAMFAGSLAGPGGSSHEVAHAALAAPISYWTVSPRTSARDIRQGFPFCGVP
jgi:hypothetical protein